MKVCHSKIIGITGGIATGKSTVSNWFRQQGYPVICADEIAHEVVIPRKPAYKEIINTFGTEILNSDKTINRNKLGKIIFINPTLKKTLEQMIHPPVIKKMLLLIKKHKKNNPKFIFLDIPLLFESNLQNMCDKVICVAAPQNLQIKRLIKYRNMSRKQALERIKAQMPLKEKVQMADLIIKNNRTHHYLKEMLTNLINSLHNLQF